MSYLYRINLKRVISSHIGTLRVASRSRSTRHRFNIPLTSAAISHAVLYFTYNQHTGNSDVALCQPQTVSASPSAVKAPVNSSVLEAIKKSIAWIVDLIRLLIRLGLLAFHFSPAAVTAPALLINSERFEQFWWELVRSGIFASGPCLTKFAQWAATRPDIFHPRFCKELEHLQAHSYQHSWRDTVRTLNAVYGEDWQDALHLDQRSVTGSGLIAQVYKGKYVDSETGEHKEVAVKVLHPGVRKAMEADLVVMRFLAESIETTAALMAWVGRLGSSNEKENRLSILETTLSLSDSVEEFREMMLSQLDLSNEGDAMLRFRRNFSQSKWKDRVIFAEPIDLKNSKYAKRHPDVLIESYQHGQPMADYLTQRAAEGMRTNPGCVTPSTSCDKSIAALGLDIILKMIFEDNFIHGDLHPGNLLLATSCAPKKSPGLVVLDTGLCTELRPQDRQNLILLFKAVLDRDGARVGRLMIEKSRYKDAKHNVIDAAGFEKSMQQVIDDAFCNGLKLRDRGVSDLLSRVLRLCYKHRVRLESGFASVVLSIGVVEGLGMQLDPEVDVISRAAPFILRAAANDCLASS